jgi:hypothetical protein
MYRFYRFTNGVDILRKMRSEDAIGRSDRALTKFTRKLTKEQKFRKNGNYEKTEDANNREIGSYEEEKNRKTPIEYNSN